MPPTLTVDAGASSPGVKPDTTPGVKPGSTPGVKPETTPGVLESAGGDAGGAASAVFAGGGDFDVADALFVVAAGVERPVPIIAERLGATGIPPIGRTTELDGGLPFSDTGPAITTALEEFAGAPLEIGEALYAPAVEPGAALGIALLEDETMAGPGPSGTTLTDAIPPIVIAAG